MRIAALPLETLRIIQSDDIPSCMATDVLDPVDIELLPRHDATFGRQLATPASIEPLTGIAVRRNPIVRRLMPPRPARRAEL